MWSLVLAVSYFNKMNQRIVSGIMAGFSLLLLAVSLYFSGSAVCEKSAFFCSDWGVQLRSLFFVWSIPMLILSIIFFSMAPRVFFTWAKFAVPAFIIMVGIMLYTYNNTPDVGGWVDWGSDDQFATLTLPPLFFIISVIIIARKARRLRHFDSKKSVPTF